MTSRTRTSESNAFDAIAILTDDHKKIQKLFKNFDRLKKQREMEQSQTEKRIVAEQICAEFMIHSRVEEEIFYPAARINAEMEKLIDEAEVEHASADDLISKILAMDASDSMHDATVAVLGEYVNFHFDKEQTAIFPKVKKARLDREALGEEISMRKEELKMEMIDEEGNLSPLRFSLSHSDRSHAAPHLGV